MKSSLLLIVFATMMVAASAERALGCSCAVSPDSQKKQITKAYTGSVAVFSGKVVEIKPAGNEYEVVVKFAVIRRWKGKAAAEIIVRTAKDSAMCGYDFEVGREYLVYASGSRTDLSVSNCSRTTGLSSTGDIRQLTWLKRRSATRSKR